MLLVCFSQFEEKHEEINRVANSSIPSTSEMIENPITETAMAASQGHGIGMQRTDTHTCADVNASEDFVSGIMKIVPDIDVSFHYRQSSITSENTQTACVISLYQNTSSSH